MWTIAVNIETHSLELALKTWAEQSLPVLRRELVRRIASEVVERIAALTPIDTGRGQQGWRDGATLLTRVVTGSATQGEAVVQYEETREMTTLDITNTVNYLRYGEYGTTREAPRRTITQSLSEARHQLPSWFRELRKTYP